PSDSPTRHRARRFVGALRCRGSLAALARPAARTATGLDLHAQTGLRLSGLHTASAPALVLLIALTLTAVPRPVAAQACPPIPRLALDTYPAAAREALSRVHKDATARPTDAAAIAALARTLHAWEQWDAAHHAYLRCQGLAPRAFDCHYLDALVLQRLA